MASPLPSRATRRSRGAPALPSGAPPGTPSITPGRSRTAQAHWSLIARADNHTIPTGRRSLVATEVPAATANAMEFPRFDLEGQTALVTGAARGIGRAIALALAHAGADVALGLRQPGSAQGRVAETGAMGRRATAGAMDVRRLEQIAPAVEEVRRAFGRLDILVNNAGLGPSAPAEDVIEEDFDLTFDVNVKGVFFASQAAGRVMIQQGYGRIVSLSSQAGFVALPTESVYCMSKAAVAHMTKCLAVEWGRFGITVNAVAPTFIRTPGTEPDL